MEASATGILEEEEEQGKFLGGLPSPRSPREVAGPDLTAGGVPYLCKWGWLTSNQSGVSHSCSEPQQLLPGRPS